MGHASLPGHAAEHGLTWKGYTGAVGYPLEFYTQLKGSANIVRSDQIVADAATLPDLSMVWHDAPNDEHPVADVTLGQSKVWQAVDAIVQAGHWDDTVFLLTWDDWGGFDDHVSTPNLEHTPEGVQLAYGPRVPLIMFGGKVTPGIDSRWNSHVSIGKTVLDLLGLPPLGVPRLDDAVSLADLINPTPTTPPPPGHSQSRDKYCPAHRARGGFKCRVRHRLPSLPRSPVPTAPLLALPTHVEQRVVDPNGKADGARRKCSVVLTEDAHRVAWSA